MTDRPIIFSGTMVQALLAGRKTMTRRLALTSRRLHEESTPSTYRSTIKILASPWQNVKPGDRIWVRENLKKRDGYIHYAADDQIISWEIQRAGSLGRTWPTTWLQDPRPSIHMPRDASRLTLVVTGVKVERLQDIGDADAIAEGVEVWRAGWSEKEAGLAILRGTEAAGATKNGTTAQRVFYLLWTGLHGAGSWSSNPEVVALTFRVIKSNIDRVPA